MSYFGQQYPLYYPQYTSGYEKVKMITMTQTTMTETEPLTKAIVIFGATGDLCKRKLIPALYELWQNDLLPGSFTIVGAARTTHTGETWKHHLGDYPPEFGYWLDYVQCDLSAAPTLRALDNIAQDVTYFLSVPPERYTDAILNLKEADLSMILKGPEWLLKNLSGTISKVLKNCKRLYQRTSVRNRYIVLIIILARILCPILLLPVLAMFF